MIKNEIGYNRTKDREIRYNPSTVDGKISRYPEHHSNSERYYSYFESPANVPMARYLDFSCSDLYAR